MGEFLRYAAGVAPPGVGGKGLFGGSPSVPVVLPAAQFVVGAANTNSPSPIAATAARAAFRGVDHTWHAIDVTALGARGIFGVYPAVSGGGWAFSTNRGPGNALLGLTSAFNAAALSSTANSGVALELCAMNLSLGLLAIATLDNIILTTPDLATFTQHAAHGPGSYAITGITPNLGAGSPWVAVGLGSASNGIVGSPDALTWTSQAALFSSAPDTFATSNTVLYDGTQFVAVGGTQIATSTDGLSWTLTSIAAATSTATVIGFDTNLSTGNYYVGDQGGNVLVATTPAGIASATPIHISAHPISCAAVAGAIALLGDQAGNIFVSTDGGVTWNTENPGLGTYVLTCLNTTAGI